MCCHPEDLITPTRIQHPRSSIVWIPPPLDTIKIDVNRFFSSVTNWSDIRGVFYDHDGRMILHFGKNVSVDSAIQQKVMIIKEGLLITIASWWAS